MFSSTNIIINDDIPSDRWKKRQFRERMNKMIFFSLFAIIILSVILAVMKSKTKSCPLRINKPLLTKNHTLETISCNGKKKVCVSEGCIHSATKVLNYMNPKYDPCDNFYKFACGNFLENTVIPDDKDRFSNKDIIIKKVQEQLRSILEEEIKPTDRKYIRLSKRLYKDCMNMTAINQRGLKPVLDILKKVGGWPVLLGDSWNDEGFLLKDLVHNLKRKGKVMFGLFQFGTSLNNDSSIIFHIDRPKFDLIIAYLSKGFRDRMTQEYYKYMVDFAVMFGANRTVAEEELREPLELEMILAQMSIEGGFAKGDYELMSVKELQGNYSTLPWIDYFSAVSEENTEISGDQMVQVYHSNFFKELENVLNRFSKRAQANYIIWKSFSSTIVNYLNDDARKRKLKFYIQISSKYKEEPRWKECTSKVESRLDISLNAFYIKKYFNDDSKKKLVEIVTNTRQSFEKILENVDWMSSKWKELALDKLKSMNSLIGYADGLADESKIDELYASLKIIDGDYFQSMLILKEFKLKEVYSLMKKLATVKMSPTSKFKSSIAVKAAYQPEENGIYLPAGHLQEAFFNHDRPRYMNYGSLAFILGNEITTGFDERGNTFNKEGKRIIGWQGETMERFQSKVKCFISQYGNYTSEEVGMRLSGRKRRDRNIADNGGIKLLHLAYQTWLERNHPEPMLPGLDYTPSQLFWISAAQSLCTKYTHESLRNQIRSGVIVPEEFRILGSISNSPEFAKDFKCSKTSKMNPEKKCSIW